MKIDVSKVSIHAGGLTSDTIVLVSTLLNQKGDPIILKMTTGKGEAVAFMKKNYPSILYTIFE